MVDAHIWRYLGMICTRTCHQGTLSKSFRHDLHTGPEFQPKRFDYRIQAEQTRLLSQTEKHMGWGVNIPASANRKVHYRFTQRKIDFPRFQTQI